LFGTIDDKKNEIVNESGGGTIREVEHGGIVHIEVVIIISFFILLFLIVKKKYK